MFISSAIDDLREAVEAGTIDAALEELVNIHTGNAATFRSIENLIGEQNAILDK